MRYSAMAHADIFKNVDKPRLSVALNSADQEKWLDGIYDELDIIDKNETWVETRHNNPPSSAKLLPLVIVLNIKRNDNGDAAKYMVRLLVRANFQSKDVDYVAIYAPIAKIELAKLMLPISILKNYSIEQLDVQYGFLHATLPGSDNICIRLAKITEIPCADVRLVYLVKSLHGLHKTPNLWYQLLSGMLFEVGFRRAKHKDCLFFDGAILRPVYIVTYVDDLLVIRSQSAVNAAKTSISRHLTLTELCLCTYFIGIKIKHRKDWLLLSQAVYVQKSLESAQFSDWKPTKNSLPLAYPLYCSRVSLYDNEQQKLETVPYKSFPGSYIHLSTRAHPDISSTVSMLGKFQSNPSTKER